MSDRAAPRPRASWFPLVAVLLVVAGCGSSAEDSPRSADGRPGSEDSSSDAPIDSPEALVTEFFEAVDASDTERFLELTSSIDEQTASRSATYDLPEIMTAMNETVSEVTPTGTRQYGGGSIDGLTATTVDVSLTFRGEAADDVVVVVEELDGTLKVLVNYSLPDTFAA